MTWLLILFYVLFYLGTFILVPLLRNSLFHFLAYILVLSVSGSGHAASPELPAPAVQPQQHAVSARGAAPGENSAARRYMGCVGTGTASDGVQRAEGGALL